MRAAMTSQANVFSPGPKERTVRSAAGEVLAVPADWELLPPGDATLTRRVKAAGPSWTVQEKKGRKTFSRGVWADAARISAIRATLAEERSTDAYKKRRVADVRRRQKKQTAYVSSFQQAVLEFLDFAPVHSELARQLADAITRHATPVGSGTVARTERIPIERRAESAVIAWLRHQTTIYDQMKIPRIRGERRRVRQMLAESSRRLLHRYRIGENVGPGDCPLSRALADHPSSHAENSA
jgi:hypothetical protein